ncbi:DUF5789 family protein [Halorubrum tebenquichense]|uniref:DUF2795 domain-containing protein n=1 Tax=Halorubrum tebenquichense DSM 14210 TaxID=1227485 RepID=M0DN40_9EURY|nr:hypothetical protein [Halorubrum tebenquichense]ELZ35544.1 hypothetical protein C472_12076 [Halorubrum tebenquichense DSM 14210]
MTDEIHLSRVESALEDRAYPADREALAESFAGTTVLFADGEGDLGDLLADVDQETFESAADAVAALQNVLPIEAVGEPGQSDGDA